MNWLTVATQSDTYLIKLTPQGGSSQGADGKIICKYEGKRVARADSRGFADAKVPVSIENKGERPAYHVGDWVDDCETHLAELISDNSGCKGKNGDTKGGTNTIGNIHYSATIKQGDTW
jgi:hypothetical protein